MGEQRLTQVKEVLTVCVVEDQNMDYLDLELFPLASTQRHKFPNFWQSPLLKTAIDIQQFISMLHNQALCLMFYSLYQLTKSYSEVNFLDETLLA